MDNHSNIRTLRIEKRVCSLDLSKKLYELGVEQDGLFFYEVYNEKLYGIRHIESKMELFKLNNHLKYYSAFISSELGDSLPPIIVGCDYKNTKLKLKFFRNNIANKWGCGYLNEESRQFEYVQMDENEANSRAKMLVFVKEKGFI